jgi:hypothetical protein
MVAMGKIALLFLIGEMLHVFLSLAIHGEKH